MLKRYSASSSMALSYKAILVGEEGRTASAPPPTITRKGGFDMIEDMMGSYQVLLASSALVCPVHGVQGVLYEVAIPKAGHGAHVCLRCRRARYVRRRRNAVSGTL